MKQMEKEKPGQGVQRKSEEPATDPPVVRRKKLFSGRDLRATTIGWEMAIPIFSGPLIGLFIDQKFSTAPRWTLILLGVGLLSAVMALVRYVSYEMYVMKREIKEKEKEQAKNVNKRD